MVAVHVAVAVMILEVEILKSHSGRFPSTWLADEDALGLFGEVATFWP
jgi:hypothetical protein